jgi:hypothetical protein
MADAWFYQRSGITGDETIGPLSNEEMLALCRERTIIRDTLVVNRQATRGVWVRAASTPLLKEIQKGVNDRATNTSRASEQGPERIVPSSQTSIPWIAVALFVVVGIVGAKSSAAIVRQFQRAGWKVSARDFVPAVNDSSRSQIRAEKELQHAIRSTPKGWERFCDPQREIPRLVGKKINPGDTGTVESVLCQKILPDGTLLAWMVCDTGPARVKVYGLNTTNASEGRPYQIPATAGFVVGKEVINDAGATFTVPTLTLVDISSVLFRRLNGYGKQLAETDPIAGGAEVVEKAMEVTKDLEEGARPFPDRLGTKGRKKSRK